MRSSSSGTTGAVGHQRHRGADLTQTPHQSSLSPAPAGAKSQSRGWNHPLGSEQPRAPGAGTSRDAKPSAQHPQPWSCFTSWSSQLIPLSPGILRVWFYRPPEGQGLTFWNFHPAKAELLFLSSSCSFEPRMPQSKEETLGEMRADGNRGSTRQIWVFQRGAAPPPTP